MYFRTIFLEKERLLTYGILYALKYLKNGHLDMGNLYDKFIYAENLIDKQLVYQNQPVGTKWMCIFGELEINPYSLKTCCY